MQYMYNYNVFQDQGKICSTTLSWTRKKTWSCVGGETEKWFRNREECCAKEVKIELYEFLAESSAGQSILTLEPLRSDSNLGSPAFRSIFGLIIRGSSLCLLWKRWSL